MIATIPARTLAGTAVRASDRERESTARRLGQALTEGYLDIKWYFWPIWPILGAGIGVLCHAIPVRMAVARP